MQIFSKVIASNIYEITDGAITLLYAPFKNLVARKWRVLPLLQRKLIELIPDRFSVPQNTLVPTVLELDMSHACNLNCIYCSVNSNDSKDGDRMMRMDFLSAKSAIDRVIEASLQTNDPFSVVFIGKGEPTLNWDVLTQCVEYIRTQKSVLRVEGKTIIVTNGILSSEKAVWLARNINHIALSWDGDIIVQNTQRPLFQPEKDGGSYSFVERTASIFRDEGAFFEIRPTWTKLNVGEMVDFTKKLVAYKPFCLNYQPLLLAGRGVDLETSRSDAEVFIDNFMKSKDVAKEYGISVVMPSADITRINRKFCHAYEGTGFHLSANGSLTACECVFGEDDGLAGKLLTYGKMTESGVEIDEDKISFLKSLRVDVTAGCKDCFVRWHCAGGCLNTHLQACSDPFDERKNTECFLTKRIVWETLKRKEAS